MSHVPAPPAARFFYGLAYVFAIVGILVIVIALLGSGWAYSQDQPWLLLFVGTNGVVICLSTLLSAGLCAAIGAVIHDVRRIAAHTSPESLAAAMSRLPRAPEAGPATGPAIEYFYFENGVEHGPVTRARIRDLIRTNRLTHLQRWRSILSCGSCVSWAQNPPPEKLTC